MRWRGRSGLYEWPTHFWEQTSPLQPCKWLSPHFPPPTPSSPIGRFAFNSGSGRLFAFCPCKPGLSLLRFGRFLCQLHYERPSFNVLTGQGCPWPTVAACSPPLPSIAVAHRLGVRLVHKSTSATLLLLDPFTSLSRIFHPFSRPRATLPSRQPNI